MNNFRAGLFSPFNENYMSGDLDNVAMFIKEMCLDKKYKLPALKRVMRSGDWGRAVIVNGIKCYLRVLRVGNIYKIKILK